MDPIRLFSIISWILLPTVMFGGYSLLHLQGARRCLRPFKRRIFGQAMRMLAPYYCCLCSIISTWDNTLQCFSFSGSAVSSSSLAFWPFQAGSSCTMPRRKTRAWLSRYTGTRIGAGLYLPCRFCSWGGRHCRLNRRATEDSNGSTNHTGHSELPAPLGRQSPDNCVTMAIRCGSWYAIRNVQQPSSAPASSIFKEVSKITKW